MDTAITKEMYKEMGIDGKVYSFGQEIAESLKQRFEEIDRVAEYNQLKVVHAMQQCRASEACLYASSGYGYNDVGRDTLEEIYAATFHTESALVRPQIACGTHALAVALAGNLRPGDELLSLVGKPYDTLEEVIGIRPSNGSLAEYGVSYLWNFWIIWMTLQRSMPSTQNTSRSLHRLVPVWKLQDFRRAV